MLAVPQPHDRHRDVRAGRGVVRLRRRRGEFHAGGLRAARRRAAHANRPAERGRGPALAGRPNDRRPDGSRRDHHPDRPRHRRRVAHERERGQRGCEQGAGSSPTASATRSGSRPEPTATCGSATSDTAPGRRSTRSPTRTRRHATSAGRATRATAPSPTTRRSRLPLCTSLSSQAGPEYTYNHSANVVSGDGCTPRQLVDRRYGVPRHERLLPEQHTTTVCSSRTTRGAASGSCPMAVARTPTSGRASCSRTCAATATRGRLRVRRRDARRQRHLRGSRPGEVRIDHVRRAPTRRIAYFRRPRRHPASRRSRSTFDASDSTTPTTHAHLLPGTLTATDQYGDATTRKPTKTYSSKGTYNVGLKVTERAA